jgi:hypothetical protein
VIATLILHSAYTSSGYLQDPLVQAPAPRRPLSPHSSRTLIDTQSESAIAHDHHSTTHVPSPLGRASLSPHFAMSPRPSADTPTRTRRLRSQDTAAGRIPPVVGPASPHSLAALSAQRPPNRIAVDALASPPRALQCVRCARVYVSHTGTGMRNPVCMHLVTTAVVVDEDVADDMTKRSLLECVVGLAGLDRLSLSLLECVVGRAQEHADNRPAGVARSAQALRKPAARLPVCRARDSRNVECRLDSQPTKP